jgi:hypothetical protein
MLAIVPDHDYHEREISVSVWGRVLLSTRIARLHHRSRGAITILEDTAMKNAFVASLALASLLGMAAGVACAAGEEVQGIKVNKENGSPGDGNNVLMKGSPLPLRGACRDRYRRQPGASQYGRWKRQGAHHQRRTFGRHADV